MVFLVATTLLAEHLSAAQQTQVAKLVCEMIESTHISQKPIDDSVSAKLVDEFVKTLDPNKMYFLQSDIDRFNKYRTELDDLLKAGNVEFAGIVFDTYLTRLNERMETVHKLIDLPQDFTIKEYLEIDAKDLPWSKTAQDLNERWRKRVKYEFLLMKFEEVKDLAAKEKKRAADGKGVTMPKTETNRLNRKLVNRMPANRKPPIRRTTLANACTSAIRTCATRSARPSPTKSSKCICRRCA